MSDVTDKELLSICNLSNLKMEFANLKFIEPDTKIVRNHTISSLLENEIEGIKKRANNKF